MTRLPCFEDFAGFLPRISLENMAAICFVCSDETVMSLQSSGFQLPCSRKPVLEKLRELECRSSSRHDVMRYGEDAALCRRCAELVTLADFFEVHSDRLGEELRSLFMRGSRVPESAEMQNVSTKSSPVIEEVYESTNPTQADLKDLSDVENRRGRKNKTVDPPLSSSTLSNSVFGENALAFLRATQRLSGASTWFSLNCRICDHRLEDPSDFLKHHEMFHASDPKFVCYFCLKGFDNAVDYRFHVLAEELLKARRKEFSCDSCQEDLCNPRRLEAHVASQHPDVASQRLKCKECDGQVFPDLTFFISHRQKHLPSQASRISANICPEFQCGAEGCSFQGRSEAHLMNHCLQDVHVMVTRCGAPACKFEAEGDEDLRSHLADGNHPKHFVCSAENCHYRTADEKQSVAHASSHAQLDELPFKCFGCEERFSSRKLLEKHLLTHEFNPHRKCDECGVRFKDVRAGEAHMNREHRQTRPYVCEQCDKSFVSKCHLTTHRACHKELKLKLCPRCGKTISGNLSVHIAQVHDRKKRHKCLHCEETFVDLRTMKKHVSSVHGVEVGRFTHPCDVCKKMLASKLSLKRHMFNSHGVDIGVKIYPCPRCNKSFSEKRKLTLHINSHDGVKPEGCPFCQHRAGTFVNLQTHMKLVHKRFVKNRAQLDQLAANEAS